MFAEGSVDQLLHELFSRPRHYKLKVDSVDLHETIMLDTRIHKCEGWRSSSLPGIRIHFKPTVQGIFLHCAPVHPSNVHKS